MTGIFNRAIFNDAIFNTALVESGGGTSKKKKRRVIRFSDLSERERLEELQALRLEVRPFTEVEQAAYDLSQSNDEDEEDDLILKIVALTILH